MNVEDVFTTDARSHGENPMTQINPKGDTGSDLFLELNYPFAFLVTPCLRGENAFQ